MSDEKKSIESSKDDEKEQLESRRKALTKISIGIGVGVTAGFLPGKWVKPVVDSIIVPAHAQTSLPCECQLSNLAVNARIDTFSASYTFSNCSSIDSSALTLSLAISSFVRSEPRYLLTFLTLSLSLKEWAR